MTITHPSHDPDIAVNPAMIAYRVNKLVKQYGPAELRRAVLFQVNIMRVRGAG